MTQATNNIVLIIQELLLVKRSKKYENFFTLLPIIYYYNKKNTKHTTLAFSNKYFYIYDPMIYLFFGLRIKVTYFPNLLELLFNFVLAFPKASRIGLQLAILKLKTIITLSSICGSYKSKFL